MMKRYLAVLAVSVLAFGSDQFVAAELFTTNGDGILSSSDLGASWGAGSTSTGFTSRGVDFISPNVGWLVGHVPATPNGKIFKTTDGGINWVDQSPGSPSVLDVQFLDANNGYGVGILDTILHTTNGGSTWTSQTSGTSGSNLEALDFVDSNNGWVVGSGGAITHTTDGGANWSTQASGVGNLTRVDFIDSSIGWAVGLGGVVVHTTDGGANWSLQTTGTTEHLQGISAIDANTAWAVGANGTILNTLDGGANWLPQTSPTSLGFSTALFLDSNTGFISGESGTLLKTIDGGTNWFSLTSGTTHHLDSLDFSPVPEPSSLVLLALGTMCLSACGWRHKKRKTATA